MREFILKTANDQVVIYRGVFDTLKSCVESAVSENVKLDYVDLRGANLTNAELDGGTFRFARFDNANLSGANISDADLTSASLRDTSLYNTCFCETRLCHVQFFGASFGGTDIAWCDMSGACFDTSSALDLKFTECLMMIGAKFYERTGTICSMSRPPIFINGLRHSVVLFDDYMKVGALVFPYQSWLDLRDRGILHQLDGDIATFMKVYGTFLFALAEARQGDRKQNFQEVVYNKNAA